MRPTVVAEPRVNLLSLLVSQCLDAEIIVLMLIIGDPVLDLILFRPTSGYPQFTRDVSHTFVMLTTKHMAPETTFCSSSSYSPIRIASRKDYNHRFPIPPLLIVHRTESYGPYRKLNTTAVSHFPYGLVQHSKAMRLCVRIRDTVTREPGGMFLQ